MNRYLNTLKGEALIYWIGDNAVGAEEYIETLRQQLTSANQLIDQVKGALTIYKQLSNTPSHAISALRLIAEYQKVE